MIRVLLFPALLVAVCLGGCERGPERATALYFSEQEQGGEPFPTRMLITSKYLRIDYGVDDDDFILFDRKKPEIYSINREDKTVMVIGAAKIALAPPKHFVHRTEQDRGKEAPPAVGGKAIAHFRLFTNDEICYDVFAADGLLPQAVTALREYHQTIAGEHAAAMAHTPKEMQSACDLANFIFTPVRHLEQGFPVRQQDALGNVRQLRDYKLDYAVDEKLFQLPADFKRYRPNALRGEAGESPSGADVQPGDKGGLRV